MDTNSIWFIVPATIAVGLVCWLLAHIARASHYSQPDVLVDSRTTAKLVQPAMRIWAD
jgi:hypothetical protein